MKNLFPYIGKEVTVTEDMCDFNGHMNVNHIKAVFEQGWEFTTKDFGFDEEYLESGFSSFTLEDNYRFMIADLKKSLVFKENNFIGVCTFTYEKEAASTFT